ncbi:olfactory receptor 10V1-like [Ambystoma mexicanum]|uniref:olfactory receptor 10V1-like n=1 Tax=Ambystoma mexicanum TaxID=8296 RepID=UPI0037E931AF
MWSGNRTWVTEFIFLSFTDIPEMQVLLFLLFSALFIVILLGNISIMVLVKSDRCLHSPMYFFLATLSFCEFWYTCSVVPKMLANFLVKNPTISVIGCAFQIFFFIGLGSADCFLLAVMSYDRYVAICNPLHYRTVMNMGLCCKLVAGSLVFGFLLSLELAILIVLLPFCGDNHIQHFFCEIPVVLTLACTDTSVHEAAVFIVCMLVLTIPFLLICVSYTFIISTVVRIQSAQGRHKAFSTCTSHLTVVLLQYGVASFTYLRPKSLHAPEQDRLISLVYVFGTPLLNPLIYTLRNKEIKAALRKGLTIKGKAGTRETLRVASQRSIQEG